jgi:hypothetical protein
MARISRMQSTAVVSVYCFVGAIRAIGGPLPAARPRRAFLCFLCFLLFKLSLSTEILSLVNANNQL